MKAGHILLATAVGIGVLAGGCAVISRWKTTTSENVSSPPKETSPKEAAREEPIPLRRQDPKVVAYMGSVRRAIDLQWVYPEAALRQRVEGKLTLELTILENGQLGEIRVVSSSGNRLLDDEAIRAVKAAAPFKPTPAGIGRDRITIVTTFDYSDKRPR